MNDEVRLRVLTTLRLARRQGATCDELAALVELVRDEESRRGVNTAMEQHRASVELIRSRKDAESSE